MELTRMASTLLTKFVSLRPFAVRLLLSGSIAASAPGLAAAQANASVQIYNGLGQAVVVKIGDKVKATVAPNSAVKKELKPGNPYTIETRTTTGDLIETFKGDLHGKFAHAIYNVAGASPLVMVTVHYGGGGHPQFTALGAARWTTADADYYFVDPPHSISGGSRTRTVLMGSGDKPPDVQLRFFNDQNEAAAAVLAHATWDNMADPMTLRWLGVAEQLPAFPSLLARRLRESPGDRGLQRLQLDAATNDGKQALCDSYTQRAAVDTNDAGLLEMTLRCMPHGAARDQAYIDAMARFPNDAWLVQGAAYVYAQQGQWARAQPLMQQSYEKLPQIADSIALTLARIMRARGTADMPTLNSLAEHSPPLELLLGMDTGDDWSAAEIMKAYPALANGLLDDALKLAQPDSFLEARVLRLAAASDGASADMVQRGLALSAGDGLDKDTLWASVALAAREKRDYHQLLARAPEGDDEWMPQMQAFLESVVQGQPQSASEALLTSLPPELRGQAYSMAVVVLGKKAPLAWRSAALNLLFSMERPYFDPGYAQVQIYNGLARAVVVKIGDKDPVTVEPSSMAIEKLAPDSRYTIETHTADGQPIETFEGEVHGESENVFYNVAGASALVISSENDGSDEKPEKTSWGAPRWTQRKVDFFADELAVGGSGGRARDRGTMLLGFGEMPPDVQLHYVTDPAERKTVILVHATFDSTSNPFTLRWLTRATSEPGFAALLTQRLKEAPQDRGLLRLQLDTATADGKQALCDGYRQRAVAAPEDVALQYFTVYCMQDGTAKDEAYVGVLNRFNDDPWVDNDAAYAYANYAQWEDAAPLLDQASSSLPQLADSTVVELARVTRVRGQGDLPTLYSLAEKSWQLQWLLMMETGKNWNAKAVMRAYPELAKGHLDKALTLAQADPSIEAGVLRLAAASDGASADLAQRALALPVGDGLDENTFWASVALAAREKRDYSELLAHAPQWQEAWVPQMRAFLESVVQQKPESESEGQLTRLPAELRGQAYSMAVVVLGKKAPLHWRSAARTLLFSMERPYFAAG
jgi:hypothetical protein